MVGAAISAVIMQKWSLLFISLLALIASLLPLFFQRRSKILIPVEFVFFLTLFIYLSIFLGSGLRYYDKVWWWDVMLHTFSGVMLGFVGFLIVHVLYVSKKVQMSPIFVALFTFCFALALGALWEIYEFGVDNFFKTNMQLASLSDTMLDLIDDCFGAILAAALGFIYVKKGRSPFFYHLTHDFVQMNLSRFEKKSG